MAVTNEMIVVVMGFFFTYLVVYRNNKFFGNVAFMGLSIAMLSYSTNNLVAAGGWIMLTGAFINTIYDVIKTFKS